MILAQTRVDVGIQSKNVDFTSMSKTRPFKLGSTLPATCLVGEAFALASSSGGTILYNCGPVNTWTQLHGPATFQNQGVSVGTRQTANFIPGIGLVNTLLDSGIGINIEQAVDTALVLTRSTHQTSQDLACSSKTASASTYECKLIPTLGAYATGMILYWTPDTNGDGSPATLNVDSLGAKPLTLADGVTPVSSADIRAGQTQLIQFDGTSFRLLLPSPQPSITTSEPPACQAALRGRLWFTAAAAGTKDSAVICARDAAGSYAWRTLY